MKSLGFALLFILFHSAIQAQSNPEQIVQNNLEAYNQRNIDKFMSFIHPNVQLYEWDLMAPSASGFTEVKNRYLDLFQRSPFLHSEILGRTIIGNKVIDYEVISGRMGETKFIEMVVVYEVEENLIKKILVIRK